MDEKFNFRLCEYGCGKEAKYQLKNGKWCCSEFPCQCQKIRSKNSIKNKGKIVSNETREKMKKVRSGKTYDEIYGEEKAREIKKKLRKSKEEYHIMKGKSYEELYGTEKALFLKDKRRNSKIGKSPLRIKKIRKKYPLFSQIEEMRYNPDRFDKEIQAHCKNHNCPNSKEKGGWFTPTYIQLYERIRQVERGSGGCYFYCSQECKDQCPLFNLYSDPLKNTKLSYTSQEYETFKKFVLERDNYQCQYCDGPATHVHHERPQKLEPFFALDPDFAWSCCEKCHYKYGHKTGTECSTGNLAAKIC